MDVFLVILSCVFLVGGIIGCVLPIIPGPPLSYLGLLLMQWSGYGKFSTAFLVIWAVLVVVVTVMDYFLPVWFTRRLGGSRYGTIGSLLGLVVGLLFFPPLGIIIGPFLGALAGELINNRTDSAKTFNVALGSFLSFMIGTGLKLIVAGVITYYSVAALWS